MARDFEALLEDLKRLKEAEKEAKRIVEEAERRAERIIREAEEKAATVISEGEEKMRENEWKLRKDSERETNEELVKIDAEYAEDRRKIKEKYEERMKEAVSYIIDMVLKTSV